MFSCLPLGRTWILHAQQCAQSRGDMGGDFPSPQLSIQVGQQKAVGGGKGISRQTSKTRERKAEVGPNPTSYSHPGQRRNPRLDTHRKPRRMNRHVKYTFFISVCKVFLFLWPYQHTHASSMSFSPFASSFPLFSLSLPPPSSSSSAPSVYVSFCP